MMENNNNILLVEGNSDHRNLIKEAIFSSGENYSIDEAGSGIECLERLSDKIYDVVLLDYSIGKMNGLEVLSKIKEKGYDIPVIMVTGLEDGKIAVEAMKRGAYDYIAKSDKYLEALPYMLKNALEGQRLKMEQERLTRELKESEKKYQEFVGDSLEIVYLVKLVDDSPEIIYLVNAEGYIVTANKRTTRISGYSREELLQMHINKLHAPDVFEKIHEKFEKAGKESSLSGIESIVMTKDGKKVEVDISVSVIRDLVGNPTSFVILAKDLTEQKKAEKEKEKLYEQLIQSEKMAGIGTLSAGIAHEFNNLLAIIRSTAEFACMIEKPEEMKKSLKVVLNTSDRAAKIVKNLLLFSRDVTLEKEACNMIKLIEAVLSIIESQLVKRNITVVRKYGKVPMIEVNKSEMQQVFLNLITNARDVMLEKGGRLEISAREVEGEMEISFSDTGKGIKEKSLNKVFEPFYTTKGALGGDNEIVGTGLGLSVSYGIIQQHGGTIEVKSETGEGTTFTVKLPLKRVKTP